MVKNTALSPAQATFACKQTLASKNQIYNRASSVQAYSGRIYQGVVEALGQIKRLFQNLANKLIELSSIFSTKSNERGDLFEKTTSISDSTPDCSSSSSCSEIEPSSPQKSVVATTEQSQKVCSGTNHGEAVTSNRANFGALSVSNDPELTVDLDLERENCGQQSVTELDQHKDRVKWRIRQISEKELFDMLLTHSKKSADQYLQVKVRLDEVTEAHRDFVHAIEKEQLSVEKAQAFQLELEVICSDILRTLGPMESCKSEVAICEKMISESSALVQRKAAEAREISKHKVGLPVKFYRWLGEFRKNALAMSD